MYYRTTYTFSVLSKGTTPHSEMSFEDIFHECDEGAFVMDMPTPPPSVAQLSAKEMADALKAAGSDPSFFDLDDDGNPTDFDDESAGDPDPPTGVIVMEHARNALGVIVTDPKINAWLRANDPKALAQVESAFLGMRESKGGEPLRWPTMEEQYVLDSLRHSRPLDNQTHHGAIQSLARAGYLEVTSRDAYGIATGLNITAVGLRFVKPFDK